MTAHEVVATPTDALDGIRVVDFGQYLAGPLVAMMLADFGADVIHVDPPDGPSWDDPANAALYRGKRTVRLDLKDGADRVRARSLVESADIVIENFRPGVMPRLGFDFDDLRESNPGLIWCSMPGFASDDPRAQLPAWEGVVCAAAGLYAQPRLAAGAPVFTALPLASTFGAFVASHRIIGGLIARLRDGIGQCIEISLYEAAFQAIGFCLDAPASKSFDGGGSSPHLSDALHPRPTADETAFVFDWPLRGVQRFVDRFTSGFDLLDLDQSQAQHLSSELDRVLLERPGRDWERIGQETLNGSFGIAQSTRSWLADSHAHESETVIALDDPTLGPTVQPGFAVAMSVTKPRARWPRGTHDPSPGTAIDWLSPRRRSDPAIRSARSGLPLEGFRVLDCATLLAGPTTARVLAQYGADVIKLDKTKVALGEIDPLSDDPAAFVGARTVSAGKRSIFVDLKHPLGRSVLDAIVADIDIAHHNFTPEAAHRLGLAPERLRGVNPSLIVSTTSLHSSGGSRAAYRGHDLVAQMVTGMAHRAGGPDSPRPLTLVVNDNATGHLHAFGLMVALLHRNRTGQPQDVNAALSRTATLHQLPYAVLFRGRESNEPSGPGALGWSALNRLYPTSDGWIYVGGGRDGRQRLGHSGLLPLSSVDVGDDQLEASLEQCLSQLTVDESVDALRRVGLGAHRHVSGAELACDEYALSRHLVAVVDHLGLGPALGIGHKTLGAARDVPSGVLGARRPGMDTMAVLDQFGFHDLVDDLLRERVVALGEGSILRSTKQGGWWNLAVGALPTGEIDLSLDVLEMIRRTTALDPVDLLWSLDDVPK